MIFLLALFSNTALASIDCNSIMNRGHLIEIIKNQNIEAGNVLNLACGLGEDCFLISKTLTDSIVYGIDINPTLKIFKPTDKVHLIQGDGTLNSSYPTEKFSLIIIRHPAAGLGDYPLEELLDQAIKRLQVRGKLIVTTYFKTELDIVKESVGSRLNVLQEGFNNDIFDRYYIVYGQKGSI